MSETAAPNLSRRRAGGPRRGSEAMGRADDAPVRGALELTASASSPQTVAGSDFSIFLTVRNPFDVPISLHGVATHIPVELLDVGKAREQRTRAAQHQPKTLDDLAQESWPPSEPSGLRELVTGPLRRWRDRRSLIANQDGLARAEFSPGVETEWVRDGFLDSNTGDKLETGYYRSVMRLSPGDSTVQQFVLRTRSTFLFIPLTHAFHFQVRYEIGRTTHSQTVPFQLSIRAGLRAIVAGGLVGAFLGAALKTATAYGESGVNVAASVQALVIAVLATSAVLIGFARKSSAQPFVSIEDFWGGVVTGFSVGFIGYDQFSSVLAATPA